MISFLCVCILSLVALTYGGGGVDAARPVWETEPLVLSVLCMMVRETLMLTMTMTMTVKLMMVTMMMLWHLHIPVKDD